MIKQYHQPLDQAALEQLFRGARTYNGWLDKPVSDEQLQAIWNLTRMGPTSANMLPARIVWVKSDAAKKRLAELTGGTNPGKILQAPVTAIIGYDIDFHEQLPWLFPHTDARSWFEGNEAFRTEAAFRNSSLQGAYFIIAARALGLDTGPMSGFDNAAVDAEFFAAEPNWKSNFISTPGYGDPATIFGLDPAVLKQCIRKGTVTGELVPVLCGSSYKNKGVQQLLDAVVDYLPYPGENGGIAMVDEDGHVVGEQVVTDDAPARALAFKVINDQFGTLTFCRIYSGVIRKGDTLLNVTRGRKERVGRIVEVQADDTREIDEVRAGDICAFVSMKDTETGDSLADPAHPALLERMRFPDPVISVSVEPKNRNDVDKLSSALYKMVKADPSLKLEVDQETGQTVLKGMGELHLEVTIDRMRTELGVEANMGKPRVSFREAFGKTVEHTYTHKKQTGGSGQFAEVTMIFEPGEPGSGVVFSDEVVGGRVPREYIPAVEHSVKAESQEGQVAGYEVVDFKARLIDGKYHDVDSSALAFEIATRQCFREAQKLSKPKLLEPIMRLEVVMDADYLGDGIGDINRRRGTVSDQGHKGSSAFVQGFVPLAEMFGYINFLRSATRGRGTFTMEFDHYEDVPASMVEKLMEKEAK